MLGDRRVGDDADEAGRRGEARLGRRDAQPDLARARPGILPGDGEQAGATQAARAVLDRRGRQRHRGGAVDAGEAQGRGRGHVDGGRRPLRRYVARGHDVEQQRERSGVVRGRRFELQDDVERRGGAVGRQQPHRARDRVRGARLPADRDLRRTHRQHRRRRGRREQRRIEPGPVGQDDRPRLEPCRTARAGQRRGEHGARDAGRPRRLPQQAQHSARERVGDLVEDEDAAARARRRTVRAA